MREGGQSEPGPGPERGTPDKAEGTAQDPELQGIGLPWEVLAGLGGYVLQGLVAAAPRTDVFLSMEWKGQLKDSGLAAPSLGHNLSPAHHLHP